ncbi:SNU23 [Candida jiufengensis]|uniref:SNU23 n=1 Tax=Candida jiufengensis TaxID=497108 RepID=UPI002225715E|nr:SNU23 [Candida jiufengensis]KAI5951305.1 SNU23 [Candida jiufengensis]
MSEEQKITVDQYGRKKWNLEIYAKEAKDKKNKKNNQKDQEQSHLLDLKNNDTSQAYLKHRDNLLNTSLSAVKSFNLINPDQNNSSSFGSNKRFGFFCPICDLSFRDNLALIDHLNSPQHVNKVIQLNHKEGKEGEELGEILDGGIRRASVADVISTMEKLIKQRINEKNQQDNDNEVSNGLTFSERIERRKQFEDQKRAKRSNKRQLQKQRKKQRLQEEEDEGIKNGLAVHDNDMNEMMGFATFGSTKAK